MSLLFLFITLAVAIDPAPLLARLAHDPTITPPPTPYSPPQHRRDYGDLLEKRQDLEAQTCGYFEADYDEPYTCDSGYGCFTHYSLPYFGCCVTNIQGKIVTGSCASVEQPYTSCVEYVSAAYCTGTCALKNRVCDSTYKFCGVGYSLTSGTTYTNWFCQSIAGGTPSLMLYPVATTNTPLTSTTRTPTPTTTPKTTPIPPSSTTSTVIDVPPTSEPVTIEQVESGGGTNTGAIAGGVVGGLAGLAIIVLGVIFYLRHSKQRERKQAFAEVSQI